LGLEIVEAVVIEGTFGILANSVTVVEFLSEVGNLESEGLRVLLFDVPIREQEGSRRHAVLVSRLESFGEGRERHW